MALDYGSQRIGMAVSDELGVLAHPREPVPAKPPARALRTIRTIARDEGIVAIVVGLPLHLDGREGVSARRARKFADEVALSTDIEVHMLDERLTTVAAHGLLQDAGKSARQSRALVDSASAAILLQTWLDSRRGRE